MLGTCANNYHRHVHQRLKPRLSAGHVCQTTTTDMFTAFEASTQCWARVPNTTTDMFTALKPRLSAGHVCHQQLPRTCSQRLKPRLSPGHVCQTTTTDMFTAFEASTQSWHVCQTTTTDMFTAFESSTQSWARVPKQPTTDMFTAFEASTQSWARVPNNYHRHVTRLKPRLSAGHVCQQLPQTCSHCVDASTQSWARVPNNYHTTCSQRCEASTQCLGTCAKTTTTDMIHSV